jgi:hypothetical protein
VNSSEGILKICVYTEKLLRQALCMVQLRAIDGNYCLKMAINVLEKFGSLPLFPSLEDHMFDTDAESNHVHILIKTTVACYLKIRLHHESKRMTEKVTKDTIRKKLTRLVIFQHQ